MILAWLALADGLVAIVLVVLGMLTAHFSIVRPFVGFQMFAIGWLLSLLGFVLGIVGILLTRDPARAAVHARAWTGTVLCLVVAVPVLVIVLSGMKYPPINDITTDYQNPPEFTHAQNLPANHGRDMKYDAAKYMAAAKKGYPNLAPLSVSPAPADVFARVEKLAANTPGWLVTYDDPKTMTIEGVATSKLFRFRDDFVIQVRPADTGGSLVEMRSKSRDGVGDFGVNYRRIETFLNTVRDQFPRPGA
jgi:uncharacterized protein (DUF1499 family)